MNNIKELYVAEYCPIQKAFHVETIYEMIETNMQIIVTKTLGAHYIPFAICKSALEASDKCDEMREIIRK